MKKLFKNDSFFKQSYKKQVLIVSIKNDRYLFSKNSKRLGRFFSKTINNHSKQ